MQQDAEIAVDLDSSGEIGTASVGADFCKRRPHGMSVLKQLLLRAWVLLIGRFSANLTRSIIQKIAITAKPKVSYRFKRTISIEPEKIIVTDELPSDMPLRRLSIGSDATSIYVANSLVYQESTLCPWQHADLERLPVQDNHMIWRREYYRGSGHGLPGRTENSEMDLRRSDL